MEIPDNCQCYCYAIMSSLCFPCQVKIHLLHLTASPHGELIKNVKCPTPKDRSPSPQSAEKDRSQTPTSPARENCAKTDCDKCDYYMNFINKLTSGLCEEKIMRMVCSNPCLVSPNLPAAPGDAKKDFTPSSKAAMDEPFFSHTVDILLTNNATNQRMPSKTSVRSNTLTSSKGEENPVSIIRNQVPPANPLAKKKSEPRPEKKPTTPTDLMTTDKMLKRSFDSMAKNRPTPVSSRTPSPEKKRPEPKNTLNRTVNLIKIDHKPPKSDNAPKNDSKPAKNDIKSSTLQKSTPISTLSKAPKNEPAVLRPMAGKEMGQKLPKVDGKGSAISSKTKPKDAAKTRILNPPVPAKKILKLPDPAPDSLIKCNEEVCEFNPGMRRKAGERCTNKGETNKIVENEGGKLGAIEVGVNKGDGNAPVGGFFEAALVMDFYQPPQLGSRTVGTTPPIKRLHTEYADEPSNPDLGGGIVKQLCNKPIRNSTRYEQGANEVNNRTEYYNQQDCCEGKGRDKQRANGETSPPVHHMIPEEKTEYLPTERDKLASKHKKSAKSKSPHSSPKKESGEEKARKNPRLSDPKKQDLPRHGAKSQAPLSAEVRNNSVDRQPIGTNETALDDKPVRDSILNGTDASEYVPGTFEQSYFDKARQREESGRYPMYVSMGRGKEDDCTPAAQPNKEAAEIHPVRRASECRRNSMHNDGDDYTTGAYPTNGMHDLPPAKILKDSIRQSMNHDEQRDGYEFSTGPRYVTEDVSSTKRAQQDISNRKNIDDIRRVSEIIPGAPDEVEYIPNTSPNTSQRTNGDHRHSKTNDKGRDQDNCTEQIREPSGCEVDTKGRRGRLSIDEHVPVAVGVVKKIREEIEDEYRRNSADKQKYCDAADPPTPKKQDDELPKSLCDAGLSHSDERSTRPGGPAQKKSRSSNRRHDSASGTSVDDATRIYPQFSEYMNPDCEGYKSKSAGNIVECHSTHDPLEIPPAKSTSERGSSKWNCGVCPDDKRVYYHTDSDGKCTSMVIGLPQDGRNSNPHIRINFNKQVKQEITCYKLDKCEQKNDYRDTGTQCDYDVPETISHLGSRPATPKSSKNRVPPKTSAKPLQASGQVPPATPPQTSGHQQMYYNRPLMRRSFQ